jgi:hypothetical protein
MRPSASTCDDRWTVSLVRAYRSDRLERRKQAYQLACPPRTHPIVHMQAERKEVANDHGNRSLR